MPIIPEETIKAVLDATDIVDVIGGYFPLKRAGSAFVCNCPFHNEKTPSFNINPGRQFFHCFGCGESGDAISFVRKYENLPFMDAVKKLADRAGVPIIEAAYDPQAEKRQRKRSRLIQLHNEAAQFMHQMIRKSPQAAHAREYLQGRGFGKEMAENWVVGWMPDNPASFIAWAKEKGFKGRELVEAGLAGLRDQNNPKAGIFIRFLDRLMFPIHNDYGDIIAFSGRQLRHNPKTGKYINSPQTMVFDKSRVFFGLDKARKHMTQAKFALICEGQIDAIACYEQGIQNAIATCGTACTEFHARLLKRYTNEAVLCYDADNAGFKAMEKAYAVLAPAGIHVRCVKMPKGDDPDSYIQANGAEAFKQLLTDAEDFFSFQLGHTARESDLTDIRVKTEVIQKLAPLTALISDKTTQDLTINTICTRLNIGVQDFRSSISRAKRAQARQRNYDNDNNGEQIEKVLPTPVDKAIAHLCLYSLSSNDIQDQLSEQLEPLYEPLNNTAGGNLLLHILSRKPDTSSNSSVLAYLANLPEPDQLALQQTLTMPVPDDLTKSTMDSVNMLTSSHYQRKETAIRAALSDPSLSNERKLELMAEAQELHKILKNIRERFIF